MDIGSRQEFQQVVAVVNEKERTKGQAYLIVQRNNRCVCQFLYFASNQKLSRESEPHLKGKEVQV